MKKKRDILRDRVVDLVLEFVKTEGDISQSDLRILFGPGRVIAALDKIPVNFSQVS